MDKKVERINSYLNNFMKFHYQRDNLIFDNLDKFMDLGYFLDQQFVDYSNLNDYEFDFKMVKKSNFIKNLQLIKDFYQDYKIDLDVDKLINDGTIEIKTNDLSEILENIDYGKLVGGLISKIDKFKSITVYNNGLITDSIIWVHELSHYRNEPSTKRNQVNNLLTEALAFCEEFIYLDYLKDKGYEYEANGFKISEFKNFYNTLNRSYPLLKIYYLYSKVGNISKDSYEFMYGNLEYYDYCIDAFASLIFDNYENIFDILWYLVASLLSIYMYISFKKDKMFLDKIKKLNDNLNNLTFEECLSLIDLNEDCFSLENTTKLEKTFSCFKKELDLDLHLNKTRNL